MFVEIQNRQVKIILRTGGGGGYVILSTILTNRKWHFTPLDEEIDLK
jgi:hypothetical protein